MRGHLHINVQSRRGDLTFRRIVESGTGGRCRERGSGVLSTGGTVASRTHVDIRRNAKMCKLDLRWEGYRCPVHLGRCRLRGRCIDSRGGGHRLGTLRMWERFDHGSRRWCRIRLHVARRQSQRRINGHLRETFFCVSHGKYQTTTKSSLVSCQTWS